MEFTHSWFQFIQLIYSSLEHFNKRRVETISTQEINAVGATFKKKRLANSRLFKAKLAQARKKKGGVSSRDPKLYQNILQAVLNQRFEWPQDSQDSGRITSY